MAKTTKITKNSKSVKNLVKIMQNSPKTKQAIKATTTTTNFVRKTVAPNIEQLAPKVYRARVTVKGTRQSFQTTAITKAKTWVKDMKTKGTSDLVSMVS